MGSRVRWMALCSLVLPAGCASIQGKWQSVAVDPADSVRNFSLGDATFNKDGTYEAKMIYDGKERTSTGTYKYAWNHLTLMPDHGERRMYEAHVDRNGRLMLEYDHGDHEYEMAMKKVGCCQDCSKPCCCKK